MSKDLQKISIRLFKGDIERMQEYYSAMGYNKAIRFLIHKHLRALDEKIANQIKGEENGTDRNNNKST